MKVKTNVRAGRKSGTLPSGGSSETEASTTTAPAPVVYTRCVGV